MQSNFPKTRPNCFVAFLLIFLAIGLAGCGSGGNSDPGNGLSPPPATPEPPSPPPSPIVRIYGLDFSPYLNGQDPNRGDAVSAEQIEARMNVIAPYTEWIRTFGCTNGLEHAGRIAHGLQLKIAMGAWIGKDLVSNEAELESLIYEAKSGNVDFAIIGSEVLYRQDLDPETLVDFIRRFRAEVPGIPVATADVYFELLAHPEVVAECDVVLSNYYPYWEGVNLGTAMAWLHTRHQLVVAAAGDKEVVVSETGWPSAGNQLDAAVPSFENATFYFKNFVSWATSENVNYFYFEAFDESWKADYEGPQGAHWGVWDEDGNLKPGMQAVFDGETVADNWTCGEIPGGTGEAAIEFTDVPSIGSFDNLRGQVWHVEPDLNGVAVYIKVNGGWWIKPYFNDPVTEINCDGTWDCDITTGGIDEQATEVAAFLIPLTYSPPLAVGWSSLPDPLYMNALAYAVVIRN
jgi:exo-beta-1,3-glucanase (GH17 family)